MGDTLQDQGQQDEVLSAEDARPDRLEQLAEESDFRLEYSFEQIQVQVGETVEDVEDDEEIHENEGVIMKELGVPMKHFWIMALGLFFSTVAIFWMLFSLMKEKVDGEPLVEENV